MIKILNQQFQPVAILENAYGIGYEKSFNEVWTANFTLPLNDEKNDECQSLYFVEITDNEEYIGLFRIIPTNTVKNENTNEVKYNCEHVLATLLDDVLFLYHDVLNSKTSDVLQYILNQQSTKHWKLGNVDFVRYFSYKWENENLLSALFSVPNPFDVAYQWTWDTSTYPWTLNLVSPETEVTCEIRYGKNQIGVEREIDPTVIFNRIYPLGYGEGDNQLNIKPVNGGVPYVEDAESIAKYGLRSYIWVDKRFEDAATLKANADALLMQWKEPKVTYKTNAADISSITGEGADKLKMGSIVRMVDDDLGTIEARIMKESKSDVTGNPGAISLEIANKTDDLATTQTDLERRQQINELYAQGATNIDSHDYNDNADPNNPAEITFYLPDELVKINKLLLSFKTDKFRAYEKATKGGGGSTQTSSSGGGATVTSASGGGTTVTSDSKDFSGVTLMSDIPWGSTTPPYELHQHAVFLNEGQLNHNHNVSIPAHTHSVSVPAHSHSVNIPDHTHDMDFGIYKLDKLPTAVTIKVDGNTTPFTQTSGDNIDLIPYLSKDTEGKVIRGWHSVSIAPNDLGRINANIYTQFFIQSRGSGSY